MSTFRPVVILLALAALTTASLPAGASLAVGASPAALPPLAGGGADPVDVTVDASLRDALAGGDRPGAVVTTWDRGGLDRIEALGVTGARLRALPMLLVPALTAEQLAALAGHEAVRSVWANESSTCPWRTRRGSRGRAQRGVSTATTGSLRPA